MDDLLDKVVEAVVEARSERCNYSLDAKAATQKINKLIRSYRGNGKVETFERIVSAMEKIAGDGCNIKDI